jgi:hypothetical protein
MFSLQRIYCPRADSEYVELVGFNLIVSDCAIFVVVDL